MLGRYLFGESVLQNSAVESEGYVYFFKYVKKPTDFTCRLTAYSYFMSLSVEKWSVYMMNTVLETSCATRVVENRK